MVQIVTQIPEIKRISKITSEQSDICKNGCQDFIVSKDEQILLVVKSNEINDTLIFDSGYSGDFIHFVNTPISNSDTCFKGALLTPSGVTKQYIRFYGNTIENDLYKWGNHLVFEMFYEPITCTEQFHDLLGIGAFSDSTVIFLNFDNQQICIYDSIEKVRVFNYFEVKSSFNRIPYIYIIIGGKEYAFGFDTGCAYGFLIETKYYKQKDNDITYEGIISKDMSGLVQGETITRIKDTICLNDTISLEAYDIEFASMIRGNLVGMPFISKFNWIIDFKNHKLYAQQRENIQSEEKQNSNARLYGTLVLNDKLVIGLRNKTANPPYSLNTIIKSVNGEKINEENCCYYQELLNTTPDWSNLNIEIEK
jgi:hypothetical protein